MRAGRPSTPLPVPFFGCLVAALVLAICPPALQAAAAETAPGDPKSQDPMASFVEDTDAYLEKLEALGFNGVVLVARDGQPLLAEGYGLADREAGIPWSPGTVTTVGSITKQFTGAAILLLEEEGKLRVEDPITRYFDNVPEDKRAITLHHLLTHSSGIMDIDDFGDFDPIDRPEFVRRALEQPLAFAPGERYDYSNAGYSLLGAILEQVTGLSYEAFLRQRLFMPHGLYETGYLLPQWGEGRLAQGYRDGEKWGTVAGRPMAADGPYWVLRANGGIHTTAYDMLRWSQALLDGRVLSAESRKKLWTPHIEEGEGADTHYGYGWVVMEGPGGMEILTHNGGNDIFFADLALVPSQNAVIYLATGTVSEMPLANSLLERIGRRFALGEPYPDVPEVAASPPRDLPSRAGAYTLAGGGVIEVIADGGTLRLTPRDPPAFSALLSTVEAPASRREERANQRSAQTESFVRAMLAGDLRPMHQALGEVVTLERLEEAWSGRIASFEEERGKVTGFEVLGTALREDDWTVVRFRFAEGEPLDRAFVWQGGEGERLLGTSRRGLDPTLTFHPLEGGGYASFEPASGDSKKLTFEGDKALWLGEGEGRMKGEAEVP